MAATGGGGQDLQEIQAVIAVDEQDKHESTLERLQFDVDTVNKHLQKHMRMNVNGEVDNSAHPELVLPPK